MIKKELTPMKSFVRGLLFLAGWLTVGMFFSGCASPGNDLMFSDNSTPPALNGGVPVDKNTQAAIDADRFRVGETVVVTLSGLPDTATPEAPHQELITGDGTITMPLIGTVKAAGLTPGQLQNEILTNYVPKYYVRLTVTVNSPNRVYYVGGQVMHPGPQEYLGETTVTKAVQAAGDFTDFASHKVWLIRPNGDHVKVNCDKALRDPTLDLPVYPGDQIHVPRRYF